MLKKLWFLLWPLLTLTGCQTLPYDRGEMGQLLYSYTAQEKPSPTVILAHGCGGINSWNSQWERTLLKWGYSVVSVDSFTKRGYPNGVCGFGSATAHPIVRAQDMLDMAKFIKTQPWHKGGIAVLGMSHGGATAITTAVRKDAVGLIDASVSLYPGCILLSSIYGDPPQIPAQVHLGGKDNWTPCTDWGWKSHGFKEFVYPDGRHAFDKEDLPSYLSTQYNGMTFEMGYDYRSSEAMKDRVKEFFSKHLMK
jgi:dienelactone hydrolase